MYVDWKDDKNSFGVKKKKSGFLGKKLKKTRSCLAKRVGSMVQHGN